MSRTETLHKLEGVLESFLDRAIKMKESRLGVLDGINRLDDLAAGFKTGQDLAEEVGDWFAQHSRWLNSDVLKAADRTRIADILSEIKTDLTDSEDSPASGKIGSEIDRWAKEAPPLHQKLVLKRGPESVATDIDTADTLTPFANLLGGLDQLFGEVSRSKAHLLSALDEALKKANLQKNKEALILSALTIYYLKQNGYKVEPYVTRLKEAERLIKEAGQDA